MNSFIILSSTLFFSIHTMPMETDTSSDNEVPTMEKTIEAAKKEIQESENGGTASTVYIITLDEDANLDQVIEDIKQATGGTIQHVYRDAFKGFAIEVPPEMTEENFFMHDSIIDVEKDIIIKPLDYDNEDQEINQNSTNNSSASVSSYQILPAGVNRVESDLSSTAKIDSIDDPLNVNIAVIDTGVDSTHPDLNVVYSKGFIGGNSSGEDDNGHGTHVAGIAAARDNNIGLVGVAPGARIYSLKVLNSSGWGYLSDVISAVDWVASESKTSSNGSQSDAQKNYDKNMAKYKKYMDKANSYLSRVQSYADQAQEYRKYAEENKWGLDPDAEKNYNKLLKSHDKYLKQHDKYIDKSNKYISKAQDYKARAQDYKTQAEQYLGSPDSNAQKNYDKYMAKYQKYMDKANGYLSRAQQYVSQAEAYKSQAEEFKQQAGQIKANPQLVITKTYEKYMKKYESYLNKSNKYLSKVQQYKSRAEGYKREADKYLRDINQIGVINPNKIDVVNMSIGALGVNRSLQRAIQAAVEKGVVFVVSAGNEASDIYGKDRVPYTSDDIIPAAYPEVVTVSAMADSDGQSGGLGGPSAYNTLDDTMAGFSNYSTTNDPNGAPVTSPGRGIDLAAPGVSIDSTWKGKSYKTLSGTSMAAPHVTGAFALLIAKMGQDTNNDGKIDGQDVTILRSIMIETAQPQNEWGPRPTGDRDSYPEGIVQVSSF